MSMPDSNSFASALKGLLDDTGLFERREWAKVLGVKVAAIEDWLAERSIPRSSQLNMLVTVLEHSSGIPPEPLHVFAQMAALRATLVSPFGSRMLPTVGEYMKRPIFSELSSRLAKLSAEEQGRLLEELYPPVS